MSHSQHGPHQPRQHPQRRASGRQQQCQPHLHRRRTQPHQLQQQSGKPGLAVYVMQHFCCCCSWWCCSPPVFNCYHDWLGVKTNGVLFWVLFLQIRAHYKGKKQNTIKTNICTSRHAQDSLKRWDFKDASVFDDLTLQETCLSTWWCCCEVLWAGTF